MSINGVNNSLNVLVGDAWNRTQPIEGIEDSQDILVGEPWGSLKSNNSFDNSNTEIVGEPWANLKNNNNISDNNQTIIVGEPWGSLKKSTNTDEASQMLVGDAWAMFANKKNSDGSGGAPAAVAKYRPTRVAEPDLTTMRTRAQLEMKLPRNNKSKVSGWLKAEKANNNRHREVPAAMLNNNFRNSAVAAL